MKTCPQCGVADQGDPIPQEYIDEGFYGDKTHFSKFIGYQERGVYDGVIIWHCPDCGHTWPRFRKDDPYYMGLHYKALEIIESWANGGEGL